MMGNFDLKEIKEPKGRAESLPSFRLFVVLGVLYG